MQAVPQPAGQGQTRRPDRLRRQQGMVDATQAQADHQDDRQAPAARQVAGLQVRRQGRAPAAGALHNHRVRPRGHGVKGSVQDLGVDRDARLGGRDMRRDRFREGVRVDPCVADPAARMGLDQRGVRVSQPPGRAGAATGHRFHAVDLQALALQPRHQPQGRPGLAHLGVGAGHKQVHGAATGWMGMKSPGAGGAAAQAWP